MILTKPHPYAHLLRKRYEWDKADLFLTVADELDEMVAAFDKQVALEQVLRAEVEALRAALRELVGYLGPWAEDYDADEPQAAAYENAQAALAAGVKS